MVLRQPRKTREEGGALIGAAGAAVADWSPHYEVPHGPAARLDTQTQSAVVEFPWPLPKGQGRRPANARRVAADRYADEGRWRWRNMIAFTDAGRRGLRHGLDGASACPRKFGDIRGITDPRPRLCPSVCCQTCDLLLWGTSTGHGAARPIATTGARRNHVESLTSGRFARATMPPV
jgi:hypothetical protein